MENCLQAFRRNPDGSWICVRNATLNGPGGRIQVLAGTVFERGRAFMGVDIARFLDAHAKSGTLPGS